MQQVVAECLLGDTDAPRTDEHELHALPNLAVGSGTRNLKSVSHALRGEETQCALSRRRFGWSLRSSPWRRDHLHLAVAHSVNSLAQVSTGEGQRDDRSPIEE
jgi:hypothetical protein